MNFEREIVTSTQNKYVSLARGLANKKSREKERAFRFDGVKLMCEALKCGVEIRFILSSERLWQEVLEKAQRLYGISESDIKCKIVFVSDTLFERISEENAPEGAICVAKYAESLHGYAEAGTFSSIDKSENVLLLESVRDPQNVGAIVRVAAAFGVDRIIMSDDCADIYNSKTLRASMGTVFSMRIDKTEAVALAVRSLRDCGRRVFAAALDRNSQKLGEIDVRRGDCVIIGNEGHGLSKETVDLCDGTVFIPMSDGVESLNAATAAAVLVWEFFGKGGALNG